MKNIVCIILVFTTNSCTFFMPEKTKNELEFDSLVNIIKPETEFLKKSYMVQIDDLTMRDSSLVLLYDLVELSYPKLKEKYNLKDSTQEREFLDAIAITAQIVTAKQKLDKGPGN